MKHLQWFSRAQEESLDWGALLDSTVNRLEQKILVLKKADKYAFYAVDASAKIVVPEDAELIGVLPAQDIGDLGDVSFRQDYGIAANYMAGAMANGIASVDLVVAVGKAGLLGSFGAGGLSLQQVEKAIVEIKAQLKDKPFAFNFLSNPYSAEYEDNLINLYLKYNIGIIEASAFIEPSAALVRYRVSGLALGANGELVARHKIIAKISRQEVAQKFLSPPAEKIVAQLQAQGKISAEQAEWAKKIALADDITVEADSGGHTDNRPLVSLLPSILAIRDRVCSEQGYKKRVRIGAAGGISTPHAVLSAFAMGADYVVTGSINQSCVEAGTSVAVKELLAKAKMTDVTMAPSADMFEMGVQVQVLKSGTRFPMVAKKLYELYKTYDSLQALPVNERQKLEATAFKKNIDEVWEETRQFFQQRDPATLQKAEQDPKKIMALVFRWYLGKSSMWAITGDENQMINAQVWCGQAMGAFNDWVEGSPLQQSANRKVGDIALLLLRGSNLLARYLMLQTFELGFVNKISVTPELLSTK